MLRESRRTEGAVYSIIVQYLCVCGCVALVEPLVTAVGRRGGSDRAGRSGGVDYKEEEKSAISRKTPKLSIALLLQCVCVCG